MKKKLISDRIPKFKLKKIILFTIFIPLAMVSSYSQPLLTMDEAIRIGLENNFGIRISTNELTIARNNVTAGNAGFLPEVTLNAGYEKSISDARVEVITGSELDDDNAQTDLLNAGVMLSWTLFDGMNMFVNHDRLEKLEEMGETALRMSLENTIAEIMITYCTIIQQQMLLRVFLEQVDLSYDRVAVAETKRSVGSASDLELLQAKVDMNADKSALLNQESSLANSKTRLNELLARELITEFDVIDTIIPEQQLELSEILENCQNLNTSLLLEQINQDLQILQLKSLRSERYPVINFNAGYNFLKNETEASFINYNKLLGPHFAISLDFDIFDGCNKNRKIQNAHISLQNSDLLLQQMKKALESEAIRIYKEYTTGIQLIDFESENLVLAEKNMDIAKESYQVGTISSLELRDAQKNLLAARNRLITALYNVKRRETELLLLSGKLIK